MRSAKWWPWVQGAGALQVGDLLTHAALDTQLGRSYRGTIPRLKAAFLQTRGLNLQAVVGVGYRVTQPVEAVALVKYHQTKSGTSLDRAREICEHTAGLPP